MMLNITIKYADWGREQHIYIDGRLVCVKHYSFFRKEYEALPPVI